MNLSVEEALHVFPFSEAKLIAGDEGKSRIIKSINTMDAPDVANWIKTGELLLTTAFAIKDAPGDFLRLLQKLNERGSAGIGIKLGRYWSEIPQEVLDEANRLQFPVLELPYEFAFSEQMNALFQAEYEKSTKKLHDALEKQMRLVRFTLQKQDGGDPFQTISDILAHPIVVFSARGQILFNGSVWPEVELTKGWPWPPAYHKGRTEFGTFCRIPLMKEKDCYGFLLVFPDSDAVVPDEEGLYHQAAEVLSHHMDQFLDSGQSVAGYRWSVITERYLRRRLTEESFVEQAAALGSPLLTSSHISVYLVPATGSVSDAPHSIQEALREIRREINYHPILGNLESHHLEIDDGLLYIFKGNGDSLGKGSLPELLAKSFGELLKSLSKRPARCYISRMKSKIGDILDAYEECREAKRVGERLGDDTPVILYSDLEFSYLFSFIPEKAMKKYSQHLLQPLLQKEEDYIADAFRTIEAYFANEGQINEAAKQLFIHRNTLQYRLEKLGELLDLDFRKVTDLLKLKLMLMFKHMLAIEKNAAATKTED